MDIKTLENKRDSYSKLMLAGYHTIDDIKGFVLLAQEIYLRKALIKESTRFLN